MGYRIKIEGGIPEGAETSPVCARLAPDVEEDVQGQGGRYKGVAATEDDTEGQSWRTKFLKPAEDEDAEGEGWRIKGFAAVEGEDARGNALKSHVLEIERDADGELVGRYVPSDDTEGQGARWK